MAIHDVDKDGSDRGSPAVNAHDKAKGEPTAFGQLSTVPTTDATVKQRVAFKNGVILTYDDHNRVSSVYGYIPGLANYPVLIIANYGYDVYTDILGLTAPTV